MTSISTCATSGRENSRGGISPAQHHRLLTALWAGLRRRHSIIGATEEGMVEEHRRDTKFGLTQALAAEGKAYGIRACLVYPGGMNTNWGLWSPTERQARPHEVQPPSKELPLIFHSVLGICEILRQVRASKTGTPVPGPCASLRTCNGQ